MKFQYKKQNNNDVLSPSMDTANYNMADNFLTVLEDYANYSVLKYHYFLCIFLNQTKFDI